MQICRKCKKEKPLTDFWKNIRYKNGYNTICKKCQKEENEKSLLKNYGNKFAYHSEYRRRITKEGRPNIIYSKKKHNAKQMGHIFNISLSDFSDWYINTEKKCYYCGLKEEDIEINKDMMPTSNKCKLTLDRKENSLGYVKGNIVFACSRCNLIKSNFFSSDEMIKIANLFIKNKWKGKK